MKTLETAAKEAYDLRQRERRFLQGFTDHGLSMGQVEALRRRIERSKGFPIYTAQIKGRTRFVSIPD